MRIPEIRTNELLIQAKMMRIVHRLAKKHPDRVPLQTARKEVEETYRRLEELYLGVRGEH